MFLIDVMLFDGTIALLMHVVIELSCFDDEVCLVSFGVYFVCICVFVVGGEDILVELVIFIVRFDGCKLLVIVVFFVLGMFVL